MHILEKAPIGPDKASIFFLDIETIPVQGEQAERVREKLEADIMPPKNIKRPETLATWERETKPAIVEERILKTALDPTYGEILAIGIGTDNGGLVSLYRTLEDGEANLLEAFFQFVRDVTDSNTVWVGHNIIDFDLPFIRNRAVIHNVIPPGHIPRARLEQRRIYDTMKEWAGWKGAVALNELCHALKMDVTTKEDDGLDGSKVWEMVQKGRLEDLAQYNLNDVVRVRELYKRMNFIDDFQVVDTIPPQFFDKEEVSHVS